MTAPVSPIATQETVEKIALRVAVAAIETRDAFERHALAFRIRGAIAAALSSAERRIEELVRGLASVAEVLDPHWPAKHKPGEAAWMVEEIVALANEATDVTTLKAEVEELEWLKTEAETEVIDMTWQRRRAAERAEAEKARADSLAAEVAGLREALEKVARRDDSGAPWISDAGRMDDAGWQMADRVREILLRSKDEVSRLRQVLQRIAGSHWERIGYDQTDVDNVPDLSAEEAMNLARAALASPTEPEGG